MRLARRIRHVRARHLPRTLYLPKEQVAGEERPEETRDTSRSWQK